MKHSPSPWHVEEFDQGWLLLDAEGNCIETIYKSRGIQSEANARLIAAAPDYDEAARAIFRAVESNAAPINVEFALKQVMLEGARIELDPDLLLDLFAAIRKVDGAA